MQINLTMLDLNITGFGFTELNTTLKGLQYRRWNEITRRIFRTSKTVISESDIQSDSIYKPGGTATTIVGKWQARILEKGSDTSGLGRWSFVIISSNKKKLAVITAYKPCKTTGPTTAWTQQWILLHEQNKTPDPIKAFYEDLSATLKEWRSQGVEILLLIDANEQVGATPGGLGKIIADNGLFDIIANQHNVDRYPPTYIRGSKRIDYIFGTDRVQTFCKTSGMLPFGYGYPSDHRAIFVRLDLKGLLSTEVHQLESSASRLLHSATPKEHMKFIAELYIHYEAQNLFERLDRLWNTPIQEWTEIHEMEYNNCDMQHITGMLAAERKTCKEKRFAWSPKFSKAVENKAFWKIILSLRRYYSKPSQKIINWAKSRGINDIEGIPISTINSNLRAAQKELREIKENSAKLREEHLRELLSISQESDDRQHEKRLQILIRAHQKQYAYKKLQYILKPTQRGGLSYILVPEAATPETYPYDTGSAKNWSMVHDHEQLQNFLLKRNVQHFGQAQGTPFTIPPLTLLDWGAQSQVAEKLLQGEIPTEIQSNDEYINAILKHIAQRKQLPEIESYISPDDVSKGFRKWKESTSTSPSGCHLGLRRIPAIPLDDKNLEKQRNMIQTIQAHIINIPMQQGFSPTRWQTVVNAMLEKIPGKPFLHKLRVIHILEADYNLTLKNIFGRRLMHHCEKHDILGDYQDGFRKGRSTTRTLLHNELINDYNKRLRIDNFIGMTDISGCFDRILPSIIALLNRKNGCPKAAVSMHANTLSQAKYYLKTQNGVSES
jgi:hypothetical protein